MEMRYIFYAFMYVLLADPASPAINLLPSFLVHYKLLRVFSPETKRGYISHYALIHFSRLLGQLLDITHYGPGQGTPHQSLSG